MPEFSKRSLAQLETCREELQIIAEDSIKLIPFIVIEGYRNEKRQNQLFKEGKTRAKWGKSPHNTYPSLAMDLAPVINGKIDWNNLAAFHKLAETVLKVADFYQIDLMWGGAWKDFVDMPHYELLLPKKIKSTN